MREWGIAILRGVIAVITMMVAQRLDDATEWSWFAWFLVLSLALLAIEVLAEQVIRWLKSRR